MGYQDKGIYTLGELLIGLSRIEMKDMQLYVRSDGFLHDISIRHGNRCCMATIEIYYPRIDLKLRVNGAMHESCSFPSRALTVEQVLDYVFDHIKEINNAIEKREVQESDLGQHSYGDACGQAAETGHSHSDEQGGQSQEEG